MPSPMPSHQGSHIRAMASPSQPVISRLVISIPCQQHHHHLLMIVTLPSFDLNLMSHSKIANLVSEMWCVSSYKPPNGRVSFHSIIRTRNTNGRSSRHLLISGARELWDGIQGQWDGLLRTLLGVGPSMDNPRDHCRRGHRKS